MKIDTLALPVNWEKIGNHRKANKLGKIVIDSSNGQKSPAATGQVCVECGRVPSECHRFKTCESETEIENKYNVHGPNCPIVLGIIRRVLIFMGICVILFSVPLIVLNLVGVVCRDNEKACNAQDIIYFWSTYNVLGMNPGSLPHHIIWFIFSVAMIIFTVVLRKYAMTTYKRLNNQNMTDADFCLLLNHLPDGTTQQDVKDLMEQIVGKTENVSNPTSLQRSAAGNHPVLSVLLINKVKDLYKANKQNAKSFKKFYKDQQKGKQPKDSVFRSLQLPQVKQFAGSAIVRFNDSQTKQFVMKSVKTSICGKITQHFYPFYNALSQYEIKGQRISVSYAPHPNDVQWRNFGYNDKLRIVWKILVNVFTIFLLLISSGITVGISVAIEALLIKTGIQPGYLTVLLTIIVLVINVIIRKIIFYCIGLIKLQTVTDFQCQHLSISVISSAINLGFFSIFAPIIAKLPAFIQVQTKESSSFPLVMFTAILIQSFVAVPLKFLIDYFDVGPRMSKFLHDKKISMKTQTQGYQSFNSKRVPFVPIYCHVIVIAWFSFLYGVVSPICIAIGAIGFGLYLLLQRILFNSKYSIPIYGGPRLNSVVVDMLDYLPFLIGLFNLFLYETSRNERKFEGDSRVYGIVSANIILGAIHALMPYRSILHRMYPEKEIELNQHCYISSIDRTYEQEYPGSQAYRENSVKEYNYDHNIGSNTPGYNFDPNNNQPLHINLNPNLNLNPEIVTGTNEVRSQDQLRKI